MRTHVSRRGLQSSYLTPLLLSSSTACTQEKANEGKRKGVEKLLSSFS